MGGTLQRWGCEIEGYGVPWRDIKKIIEEVTDDACIVQDLDHIRPPIMHWTVMGDQSIITPDGNAGLPFEVKTPAWVGDEEPFQKLNVVCKALRDAGAKINATCGLHIHHDMPLILKAVAKSNGGDANRAHAYVSSATRHLYARMERMLDSVQPPSRRGDIHRKLRSLLKGGNVTVRGAHATTGRVKQTGLLLPKIAIEEVLNNDGERGVINLYEMERGRYEGRRYLKLNTESLYSIGTIEYRHHAGTLQAAKIIPWAKLTGLIQFKAAEIAMQTLELPEEFTSLKEMLEWVEADPNLIEYYMERQAKFFPKGVPALKEVVVPMVNIEEGGRECNCYSCSDMYQRRARHIISTFSGRLRHVVDGDDTREYTVLPTPNLVKRFSTHTGWYVEWPRAQECLSRFRSSLEGLKNRMVDAIPTLNRNDIIQKPIRFAGINFYSGEIMDKYGIPDMKVYTQAGGDRVIENGRDFYTRFHEEDTDDRVTEGRTYAERKDPAFLEMTKAGVPIKRNQMRNRQAKVEDIEENVENHATETVRLFNRNITITREQLEQNLRRIGAIRPQAVTTTDNTTGVDWANVIEATAPEEVDFR